MKDLPNTFTEEDLTQVYDKLQLKTSAAKNFLRIVLRCTILFDGKQQDYGPDNISDFGVYGVVVRMNDKWRRIKHMFTAKRRRKTVNESIRDSFVDFANYGVIAYMLETNQWPKAEPDEAVPAQGTKPKRLRITSCPQCAKAVEVAPGFEGKQYKCFNCGEVFVL